LLAAVQRHRCDALVGGEALAAAQALTPAPDGLASLGLTRVDDLVVSASAVRTFPTPSSTSCVPRLSPVAEKRGDIEVISVERTGRTPCHCERRLTLLGDHGPRGRLVCQRSQHVDLAAEASGDHGDAHLSLEVLFDHG